MKRVILGGTLVAAVCMLISPQVAQADFAGRPLAGAGGIPAFTSAPGPGFVAVPVGGGPPVLDVTVDYSVFAPGTYAGPFAGLGGSPAFLPGAHYVYVYQIYNNGPTGPVPPGSSTVPVTKFSVSVPAGLVAAHGFGPGFDPGPAPPAGFVAPGGAGVIVFPTEIDWDFGFFGSPLSILPDAISEVVIFSSPFGPTMGTASAFDGGLSGSVSVPVPIPAPGAAVLAMMGMGAIGWVKRRFV